MDLIRVARFGNLRIFMSKNGKKHDDKKDTHRETKNHTRLN